MDALDKTGAAEGAELHRAGSRAVGRSWPGSADRVTLEVQDGTGKRHDQVWE